MFWGTTTVLEKLAIEHVRPPSGPLVALVGTVTTVVLLTPNALALLFAQATLHPPTNAPKQQAFYGGLGAPQT